MSIPSEDTHLIRHAIDSDEVAALCFRKIVEDLTAPGIDIRYESILNRAVSNKADDHGATDKQIPSLKIHYTNFIQHIAMDFVIFGAFAFQFKKLVDGMDVDIFVPQYVPLHEIEIEIKHSKTSLPSYRCISAPDDILPRKVVIYAEKLSRKTPEEEQMFGVARQIFSDPSRLVRTHNIKQGGDFILNSDRLALVELIERHRILNNICLKINERKSRHKIIYSAKTSKETILREMMHGRYGGVHLLGNRDFMANLAETLDEMTELSNELAIEAAKYGMSRDAYAADVYKDVSFLGESAEILDQKFPELGKDFETALFQVRQDIALRCGVQYDILYARMDTSTNKAEMQPHQYNAFISNLKIRFQNLLNHTMSTFARAQEKETYVENITFKPSFTELSLLHQVKSINDLIISGAVPPSVIEGVIQQYMPGIDFRFQRMQDETRKERESHDSTAKSVKDRKQELKDEYRQKNSEPATKKPKTED